MSANRGELLERELVVRLQEISKTLISISNDLKEIKDAIMSVPRQIPPTSEGKPSPK